MKTQCSVLTLCLFVTLTAGCGAPSPNEQSPDSQSSDDVGTGTVDPTGNPAGTNTATSNAVDSTNSAAADSSLSNGDAGTSSLVWVRFRFPFPYVSNGDAGTPSLASAQLHLPDQLAPLRVPAPALIVVADADGGSE